jgi:hypothetical protein
VRPISSFPTLIQADSVEVAVRGDITLSPGADADTVLAAARVALNAYIRTLRLGDDVLYAQVLRVLTELPGVADVQNLRLRAAPPRFGETLFGPPATFGDPTDIAAFEAPCGGNLTLASTQVAVFDGGSALTDLQAS